MFSKILLALGVVLAISALGKKTDLQIFSDWITMPAWLCPCQQYAVIWKDVGSDIFQVTQDNVIAW
jgi:hypothetical protein